MSSQRSFDHEKLDVYHVELEFIAWVTLLLEEVRVAAEVSVREVISQLDRASISAVLNTAEGNGRRATQQRCKFFDEARGSATECAAGLDVLVAKGLCSRERIQAGKAMLLRVVGMLTKLVERFEGGGNRVREDEGEYRFEGKGEVDKLGGEDEEEDE